MILIIMMVLMSLLNHLNQKMLAKLMVLLVNPSLNVQYKISTILHLRLFAGSILTLVMIDFAAKVKGISTKVHKHLFFLNKAKLDHVKITRKCVLIGSKNTLTAAIQVTQVMNS